MTTQRAPQRTPATTAGTTTHVTDRTREPDHDGIQRLVRSSGRAGYAIGWLYTCLHRHLVNDGQNYLSHQQVGNLAGGMSETAVRQHTQVIVDAGLLRREQIGNSVYAYHLPPRQHLTEVTAFPNPAQSAPQPAQSAIRVVQSAPQPAQSRANLDIEKEKEKGIDCIDESQEKPLTQKQHLAWKCGVRAAWFLEKVEADYDLATVQQAYQDTLKRNPDRPDRYFYTVLTNAAKPDEAERPAPQPERQTRYIVPGRDDAPAPENRATDPNGPIIEPAPVALPEPPPQPPPDTDDDDTRTVRHQWQIVMRGDYHLLDRSTLRHTGNAWTLHVRDGFTRDSLRKWERHLRIALADALCVDPAPITLTITTQEPTP